MSGSGTPEERRAMLRRLLEERAAGSGTVPPSAQQERLWVAHHLDPADPSQNLRTAIRLRGPLDRTALDASLRALVVRHPQLRATFHDRQGALEVRIGARVEPESRVVDLEPSASEGDIDTLVREEASRPFDLAAGPPIRWLLLRRSAEEHLAVVTLHHIVGDAWSMDLLLDEMRRAYAAIVGGGEADFGPPPPAYADYAREQAAESTDPAWRRSLDDWAERLRGSTAPPLLPGQGEGATIRPSRRHRFVFEAPLAERLESFSREHRVTPFMTALAALAALLHRLAGAAEVVVASPLANRPRQEWESVVGYFVNLLPVRLDFTGDVGFESVLEQARRGVLAAHDGQAVPLHRIADEAGLRPASLTRVIYQHVATPGRPLEAGGVTFEGRPIDLGRSRHDLSLTTWSRDGRLVGTLEHAEARLEAAQATLFATDLEATLDRILDDPSLRPAELRPASRWSLERAASEPAAARSEPAGGSERSSTFDALARIWRQVLDVDGVTPYDNFLDVGGDSLSALRVIERVEAELGVRLSPGDLFTQTIQQLAAACEARRD